MKLRAGYEISAIKKENMQHLAWLRKNLFHYLEFGPLGHAREDRLCCN